MFIIKTKYVLLICPVDRSLLPPGPVSLSPLRQQVVHIALGKVELNWASETDQSAATPASPPTASHAKTYNCSEDNPILDILELRDSVCFNVHTLGPVRKLRPEFQ